MDERLNDKHIGCLVAALLAVNQYPLVKVQDMLPALQREGLLSPAKVDAMSLEAVISCLVNSGYDRGNLTKRIAARFKSLMSVLAAGNLEALADALGRGDQPTGVQLLDDLPGIGPHAAKSAWTLLALL